MDWEFFETLSPDDAENLLQQFLAEESSAVTSLIDAALDDGIDAKFSLASARILLPWAAQFASAVETAPPPDLPEWLREVHEQHYGFYELDAPTKICVLRCGYFLGQFFVAEFPSLRWTTGDTETALGNMPVVAGFSHDLELPPLLVMENLFGRIVRDPEKLGDIDTAISKWQESVPN